MRRRVVLGAAAAIGVGAPVGLFAQGRPEKSRVTLLAPSWSQLAQVPLVVAVQQGFFKAEGLQVVLQEAADGPLSAPAILSEDHLAMASVPFEQVLQWRTQGVAATAFLQVARTPQVVVGVAVRAMPGFQHWRDLAGRTAGVMGMQSPSHHVLRWSLAHAGVPVDEVQVLDVGTAAGALSAVKGGRVHAIAATDPVATGLEQEGGLKVLVDTRVPAQSEQLYGGPIPGCCLVTLGEVLRLYPHTCQAMAHGLAHALQWLRTAGPGDLIKALPDAHMHGDRALYLAAFNKTRHSLSTDGLIPPEAPGHAHRVWARLGGVALVAPGDLAATYTNAFARLAKARFRV